MSKEGEGGREKKLKEMQEKKQNPKNQNPKTRPAVILQENREGEWQSISKTEVNTIWKSNL